MGGLLRPVCAGGGHLQHVAPLNWVGLVQRVGSAVGDRLAVVDGVPRPVVDIDPQEPGPPPRGHTPHPRWCSRFRPRWVRPGRGPASVTFAIGSLLLQKLPKKLLSQFFNKKERSEASLSPYYLYYHMKYITQAQEMQGFSAFFRLRRCDHAEGCGIWPAHPRRSAKSPPYSAPAGRNRRPSDRPPSSVRLHHMGLISRVRRWYRG